MITVGTMRLPQPEPLDDLEAFLRGLEPDGGYWATMRRLADHDHSGGLMGVPVAGSGGVTAGEVQDMIDASIDAALAPVLARITALETSVAALKVHVHELGTFGAGTLAPTGGIP